MRSSEMNLSIIASLRESHEPGEAREYLIERHADEPDREDRRYHVGDRQVVPLVPYEVADAGPADQHFGGDDDQPGDADGDAHAGEDGACRRRQDDGEGAAQRADLERLGDIEPFP